MKLIWKAIRRIIEILFWVWFGAIAGTFVWAAGAELFWIIVLAIPIGLLAAASMFGLTRRWYFGRWRGAGLIWTTIVLLMIFAQQIQIEQELTDLLASDVDAYLERLKDDRPDPTWLAELERLRPEQYRSEIDRRTSEQAANDAQELQARYEREAPRVACRRAVAWLEQIGLQRFRQQTSLPQQDILSVYEFTSNCTATLRSDGRFDVTGDGINIAVRDRPTIENQGYDAVVQVSLNGSTIDARVCTIAWSWFELTTAENC